MYNIYFVCYIYKRLIVIYMYNIYFVCFIYKRLIVVYMYNIYFVCFIYKRLNVGDIMDKYLEYLRKNLERTLGKKMTIGKTTKIIGAKTEEEIKEMEKEGKKILDITTEEGIRLGDIKNGSMLYETFNEFEDELKEKGVDYDHIQDAWYVWRTERMADKMEGFDKEIKKQLKVLVNETIENFHEEEVKEEA